MMAFRDQDLPGLIKALAPLGSDAVVNLEVRGDRLVVEATNGEARLVWSDALATAKEAEEGLVTCKAHELTLCLGKSPRGVKLTEKKGRCLFEAGGMSGFFPTLADKADLFLDETHELSGEQCFDCGALLDATAGVAGYRNDKLSEVQPGVYLPFLTADAVFATDGTGAAFAKISYSGEQRQLPWSLASLPLDRTGAVSLTWGATHLRVDHGPASWYLPLRVIPDTDHAVVVREKFIPEAEKGPLSFHLETDVLRGAVERLKAIVGGAMSSSVILVVLDNELTVETPVDVERGGSLRLPLHTVEGAVLEAGKLGLSFLLSALACHRGDLEVRRPAAGEVAPWLFRSEGGVSILMPLRREGGAP